jgi:murein DD-endopeptidase MepM/ murein hydrolase activator NlpD
MSSENRPRLNPAHVSLGGVIFAALFALIVFALTGQSAAGQGLRQKHVLTPKPNILRLARLTPPLPQSRPQSVTANAGLAGDVSEGLIAIDSAAAAFNRGELVAFEMSAAALQPSTQRLKVRRGDTLIRVLTKAGVAPREGQDAIDALTEVFDPRRLRIGQEVTVEFYRGDGDNVGRLLGVRLEESVDRAVGARRHWDGKFVPQELVREFKQGLVRTGMTINDSLYVSAKAADLPSSVLIEAVRILSFDIDFQREIQRGNRFEVVFERYYDDAGRAVKEGKILALALQQGKRRYAYYLYSPTDTGDADYFDETGRSVRKTLMRTPVDGARLTSRFGRRRHPILRYTRMHPGIDFGAPSGTPIMAAGDGVVEVAGRNGGYGRYIRIRHNGSYKTAYAHLRRYARGIRRGRRVKQGQIIGYVGSSGRSTGPHLHYEILVDGRQVNPLTVRMPTGRRLKGKELARYQQHLGDVLNQIAATPLKTRVAQAN